MLAASYNYFDLLPPELVRTIVEEAGRVSSARPYKKSLKFNKATLRSLCLTSHRFRSVAQPHLFSTFTIPAYESSHQLELLLGNNSFEALASIRKIYLAKYSFEPFDLLRLAELAQAAVNLRDLSCRGSYRNLLAFDGSSESLHITRRSSYPLLLTFRSKSDITTLSLSTMDIPENALFRFPRLKYLKLSRCSFEGGRPELDLPSLRHLKYTATDHPLPGDQLFALNAIASALLSVTCDLETTASLPLSITSNLSVLLCHDTGPLLVEPAATTLDLVSHLRLELKLTGSEFGVREEVKLLESWTTLIKTAPRLQTLTLFLDKASVDGLHFGGEAMATLLEVCDERQVKVFREERSEGDNFWDEISPALIRMAESRARG
jgi:hypothetical protein